MYYCFVLPSGCTDLHGRQAEVAPHQLLKQRGGPLLRRVAEEGGAGLEHAGHHGSVDALALQRQGSG